MTASRSLWNTLSWRSRQKRIMLYLQEKIGFDVGNCTTTSSSSGWEPEMLEITADACRRLQAFSRLPCHHSVASRRRVHHMLVIRWPPNLDNSAISNGWWSPHDTSAKHRGGYYFRLHAGDPRFYHNASSLIISDTQLNSPVVRNKTFFSKKRGLSGNLLR